MSFEWTEYLRVARFLRDLPEQEITREAFYRSAVSRAYYAAFCHARNYARDKLRYHPTYTTLDHEDVRNLFRSRGMGLISSFLVDLRNWRNQCDYEDAVVDLETTVDGAIRRAGEVIRRLRIPQT